VDDNRFDALSRSLGVLAGRRATVRALAGGLVGNVGLNANSVTEAKKKKKKCKAPNKKCGKKCCPPGKFCDNGACSDCYDRCSGQCCPVADTCTNGQCVPCPDLADSCFDPATHCDNAVPGHFCVTSVEGGNACAISTTALPYICTDPACTTDAQCETALGVAAMCITCGKCTESGTACARLLPE
jgi:hypothetical protein